MQDRQCVSDKGHMARSAHPARTQGRADPSLPTARRGREGGVVLIELALLLPVLTTLIFTSLDYGRLGQYQNRLSNSAREGASIATFSPLSVNTGCHGDRNVTDRVKGQDSKIATNPGFSITVAKKDVSTGALTAYTGCDSATNGVVISPGDRIVVTVKATVKMTSPLTIKVLGSITTLTRSVEVVVQG